MALPRVLSGRIEGRALLSMRAFLIRLRMGRLWLDLMTCRSLGVVFSFRSFFFDSVEELDLSDEPAGLFWGMPERRP